MTTLADIISGTMPSEEELTACCEARLRREDKTCLSYWFPKLESAGLPVPKTRIVSFTDRATYSGLGRLMDGEHPDAAGMEFIAKLQAAVGEIGCPCFLRTGQTSGKHNWNQTCWLESPEDLLQHVASLIEFSECADMIGLAWNVWVVRELLPTMPVCTLPNYGDMPLCREFRCFVDGVTVLCCHPYWPRGSVEEGFPLNYDGKTDDVWGLSCERKLPADFDRMYERIQILGNDERANVMGLAARAGDVVGGRWSVDILETREGWKITDMAEMDKSYHWYGCKNAPKG